jgi:hypothetical protein
MNRRGAAMSRVAMWERHPSSTTGSGGRLLSGYAFSVATELKVGVAPGGDPQA